MLHAYKLQLLLNLTQFYDEPSWRTLTWFEKGRDELLFVLPVGTKVKPTYDRLYQTLDKLPDINYPAERTVISFCYTDGSGYCSRLINPNKQDEINLALIGYTPSRSISKADLQELAICG